MKNNDVSILKIRLPSQQTRKITPSQRDATTQQDFWLRRNEIDYTRCLRLAFDAVVRASIQSLFAWPTAFLAVIRASNQERLL
jgi:hypothetical protein